MMFPKISSFKSNLQYHLSGGIVNLHWSVSKCLFVVLKIGNKIKFYKGSNQADIFLYSDQKAILLAFGLFSIKTDKVQIKVNNLKNAYRTYKFSGHSFKINRDINTSRIKNLNPLRTNTNFNLQNINFTLKEININQ